jgi:hypothetical protein
MMRIVTPVERNGGARSFHVEFRYSNRSGLGVDDTMRTDRVLEPLSGCA